MLLFMSSIFIFFSATLLPSALLGYDSFFQLYLVSTVQT